MSSYVSLGSGSGLQICSICQHCPDTFDFDCSCLHLSPVYGGLTALPVDLWRQTRDAALSCQHCPAGAFGLFTSSYVGSGQRHIFTSRRSAAHCAGEFVETETRDAALMLHSSRFDAALSSSSHLLAVSEHVYVSWQNIFVWHQHLC